MADALYETSSPEYPKHALHYSFAYIRTHMHCSCADAVNTYPGSRLLTLYRHTHAQTHLCSWIPSSSTTAAIFMTLGGRIVLLKEVSVTQVNTLLNASRLLYRRVERSETIIRTIGYAPPATLHEHDVVQTTTFVSPPRQWQTTHNHSGKASAGLVKSASGDPATLLPSREPAVQVEPEFLQWLYNMVRVYTHYEGTECAQGCGIHEEVMRARRTGDVYARISFPVRWTRPSLSYRSTTGV